MKKSDIVVHGISVEGLVLNISVNVDPSTPTNGQWISLCSSVNHDFVCRLHVHGAMGSCHDPTVANDGSSTNSSLVCCGVIGKNGDSPWEFTGFGLNSTDNSGGPIDISDTTGTSLSGLNEWWFIV